MLVYITSDDATNALTRKLEDVSFADERVGIGSKFFKCIKVTAGNAMQDRLLTNHGKSTPRIVLIKRDYTVTSVLERKNLGSGKLVKAMAKLARAEYKNSFDSMVSSYAKLLNELDRLEGKKAQIADNERRLREKPNKSKAKKIEREKAKFEKSMDKWKKAEEKLLTFKSKPLKKPAAA
ncbi:MAG: hypothetical protein ACYTGZ_02020 [Planctomycetota bacterium]